MIRGQIIDFAGTETIKLEDKCSTRYLRCNIEERNVSTLLNGFEVGFSSEEFDAYISELADPEELRDLRKRENGQWFFHWREGKLYSIPEVEKPDRAYGIKHALHTSDHVHLGLLARRINDRLPERFPKYNALRRRPFEFLGQRDELVSRVTSEFQNVHQLVSRFKIRPRFELDARLYELRDGTTKVGLFLSISTRWEIIASVLELVDAGIDVNGLNAIRRTAAVDERRLVGRISGVDGNRVLFSESFDNMASIDEEEVYVEGSRSSFKRCLEVLLRGKYSAFDKRRADAEGELLGGPGIEQLCQTMGEVLVKNSPIPITNEFQCRVLGRISPTNSNDYKTIVDVGSGDYCFDPSKQKRAKYAWQGITKFGPYSRDTFSKKSPRILVVCPDKASGTVSQFLGMLAHGITSIPDSRYAGGFAKLFHLHNPEFRTVAVPLLGATSADACMRYAETIEKALGEDSNYDAALVAILDEHSALEGSLNPYLHAKAILLASGVAVQQFRMATASGDAYGLQYVLQNVAVSLYAKMGGVPWTVDQGLAVDDEVVIGMGTAELLTSRFTSKQRYVGITTVFRGDGNYLLGHLSKDCSYEEYPQLLEQNTSKILRELRERNGWRQGDTIRIVFHAHKPLKRVEIANIVKRAANSAGDGLRIEFAFLTVSNDHPFMVIDPEYKGLAENRQNTVKGRMVPPRGRIVQLGRYTRLLCTKGPTLIKRPQTPLPTPLLISLHKDSTYRDLQYLSEQVLKFTNLSWRGTQPAEDPVTIYYSQLIAKDLSRLRTIDGWSPTSLNTRLKHSMWFL